MNRALVVGKAVGKVVVAVPCALGSYVAGLGASENLTPFYRVALTFCSVSLGVTTAALTKSAYNDVREAM